MKYIIIKVNQTSIMLIIRKESYARVNTIIYNKGSNSKGLDALAKVNAILACRFDGRGTEDDALAYINLIQEAFLYLRNKNTKLHMNILGLVQLCKEQNIEPVNLLD